MDGGRLGPAVRAFRHSPPNPPRFPETCWLPARSRRRAAPGAEPGRLPGAAGSGVSGGEEGRTGRAEGAGGGVGAEEGAAQPLARRPRAPPFPAALAPSIPPSQPPGDGVFPFPAPRWMDWGGGVARRGGPGGWNRSPGTRPGSSARAGMPLHMATAGPRGTESPRLPLSLR